MRAPSSPGPGTGPIGIVGLVGLGRMGHNLARNIVGRGGTVVGFDPAASSATECDPVTVVADLAAFARSIPEPRRIIIMVPAGRIVDDVITGLLPHLDPGDVLVDGGNSHPYDTSRRVEDLAKQSIHLIGAGISGGEEGALSGPSIMPGGSPEGWPIVSGLLERIAAQGPDGSPCCTWIGPAGSGHLAKTIHNGIEYAIMQVIAECVTVLESFGHDSRAIATILDAWGAEEVGGLLVSITADILRTADTDGTPLVHRVLDAVDQRGTGRWTVELALRTGSTVPVITAAVLARSLSSLVDERIALSGMLTLEHDGRAVSEVVHDDVREALSAAMMVAFVEGLGVLAAVARSEDWSMDPGRIVADWRAGSILRTTLLGRVARGLTESDGSIPLVLTEAVSSLFVKSLPSLRRTVLSALEHGLPVPALSASLSSIDGMRTVQGSGRIVQAQRDRFGAHTFERVDRPRGLRFHAAWRGEPDRGD